MPSHCVGCASVAYPVNQDNEMLTGFSVSVHARLPATWGRLYPGNSPEGRRKGPFEHES